MKKLKVAELFAGVGGFRLGLEGWQGKSASSSYQQPLPQYYTVVWSNQWEPATKVQHASDVYQNRWSNAPHSNEDIESIDVSSIADHDVLVGGFPCQDYSVASTLKNAKGLMGKKGVLWWSIYKILNESTKKPSYLILENVDRLLNSPSTQRGRDFAIILQSLNSLGYAAEWRVINAADYGMPQRRRRVFIVAYHKASNIYQKLINSPAPQWLYTAGVMAQAFPIEEKNHLFPATFQLDNDLTTLSKTFGLATSSTPFLNTGLMLNGYVTTEKTTAAYNGKKTTLNDLLVKEKVDAAFYIPPTEIDKWQYLKGGKKETRVTTEGFEYAYSEGSMSFPDCILKPARTIITGEGGASASRFKHVIDTPYGYRRLTPLELERINMFPDNHTLKASVSDTKRAFFMGNALVVGVVEKIGQALYGTHS
jgi:DNA (cytosine-5)-methyltransferase 1